MPESIAAHPGQPEPRAAGSIPRVHGVSRVHDNPCAVLVMLKAEPTDNELRAIHDCLTCQPEPRDEVADSICVPARVVELLGIIKRDGVLDRASELQEVYRLIDATRA